MFPTRMFADRYFAPRYFPKVGATPAPSAEGDMNAQSGIAMLAGWPVIVLVMGTELIRRWLSAYHP